MPECLQCGKTFNGRGLALHEAYCHVTSWGQSLLQYLIWFFLASAMIGLISSPF
jgi:hypothetical protein